MEPLWKTSGCCVGKTKSTCPVASNPIPKMDLSPVPCPSGSSPYCSPQHLFSKLVHTLSSRSKAFLSPENLSPKRLSTKQQERPPHPHLPRGPAVTWICTSLGCTSASTRDKPSCEEKTPNTTWSQVPEPSPFCRNREDIYTQITAVFTREKGQGTHAT